MKRALLACALSVAASGCHSNGEAPPAPPAASKDQPARASFYDGQVVVRKSPPGTWQWHPLAVGGGGYNMGLTFDPSDPDRIYSASDVAGIIKSEDGGRHWLNSNVGLQGRVEGNYGVGALAVDPSHPRTLYASVGRTWKKGSGVTRSDDGGESWEWLSGDVCAYGEGSLGRKQGGPGMLVDPKHPERLYLADTLHNNGAGGVWLSDDGGRHWKPSGLDRARVTTIRLEPGNPDILWASSIVFAGGGGGIFRSADRGATWKPAGLAGKSVYDFQFDSGSPSTVYAAAGSDGAFRTTDAGTTWTETVQGLPLQRDGATAQFYDYSYKSIDADPFRPGHVVVAADVIRAYYESADGGASWHPLPAAKRTAPQGWMLNDSHMGWHTSQLQFHPLRKGELFASDFFGIWQSRDGGASWEIHPYGAENSCMTTVLPDAEKPGRLYLGIWDHDFLVYQDDPAHPATQRVQGVRQPSNSTNHHVSAVAQFRESPDILLAVANSDALIRSVDRGIHWERIDKGLPAPESCFWRIGFPALAEGAGMAFLPVNGAPDKGGGIYRSSDKGLSWNLAPNLGLPEIDVTGRWDPRQNVFVADPKGELLAIVSKGRLFVSLDRAQSWQETALPAPARSLALLPSPEGPSLVVGCSKGGGLLRSGDKGKSWTSIGSIPGTIELLAADPGNPNRILAYSVAPEPGQPAEAGRNRYSLFLTEDGGNIWTSLFNDSLSLWVLRGLAFDPFDPNRVFANTQWGGAWTAQRPEGTP